MSKKDIVLAIVLAVFVSAACLFYGGSSSGDDTFIYMRYVQNHLDGYGYVYNPGEISYGSTSILWMILMTPITNLFGNELWIWKLSSIVLMGLRTLIVYCLIAQISPNINITYKAILTLIISFEPHTFRWGSSGMENALALMLFSICSYYAIVFWQSPSIQRGIILGVVLALLPFARPEFGLFIVLTTLAFILTRKTRPYFISIIITISFVALPFALFSIISLGSILPQTAEAKSIFLRQTNSWYGVKQTFIIFLREAEGNTHPFCAPSSSGRGSTKRGRADQGMD